MLAAAAMVFGAVSCNKEKETNDLSNRPVRLTATTEGYGDTKTDLHGHALTWSNDDQISVMCQNFTTAGVYQVLEGGRSNAEFVYTGDEATEPTLVAPFQAGYPAEYWNSDVTTITLPAQQNYVENGMEKFPMYGEVASGMGVDFKNLCGVIRLRLVKSGESVTKIVLSTTKYMNGEFSVSMDENGLPVMQHSNGGDNVNTLICAEPVSINSATDFYIYLPAGTYNPMRIEVYNNRGLLCEMNSTANITIERNKITTIAPSADQLRFTLVSGLISVSATKQVRFATGNLLYDNATREWKNADDQWVCFYNNSTTSGERDVFRFSAPNSNYGLAANTADFTGDFVDWGTLIPGNWRTLTIDEYLFAAKGTYDGIRGCKGGTATINVNGNSINGLILMPDEFEQTDLPSDISFYFYNYSGTRPTGTSYQKNQYNVDQWNIMQNKFGAVFLPFKNNTCKSYRTATTAATTPGSNYGDPNYSDIFNINISQSGPAKNTGKRNMNYYVRLVQDYEPLTIEVTE